MQLFWVQQEAQRQPASMPSPHLSLEKFKVTGSMLRPYVSKAEFRTRCIVSIGLISSTVFEAVESGSLRTKASFSELPLCVSSCLRTFSKLGNIFPRNTCLTVTQLSGLTVLHLFLHVSYLLYMLKNQVFLSAAFVGPLQLWPVLKGHFLCEWSGISSITPVRPGTWTVHCL